MVSVFVLRAKLRLDQHWILKASLFCLLIVRVNLLVNGALVREFNVYRGAKKVADLLRLGRHEAVELGNEAESVLDLQYSFNFIDHLQIVLE